MEDVLVWSILVPLWGGSRRAMPEMFHAVKVGRSANRKGWYCPSFTRKWGQCRHQCSRLPYWWDFHSRLAGNTPAPLSDRMSDAVGQTCRGANSWFSNLWFTVLWYRLLYSNRKWLSVRAERQQHTWTGCLEKIHHVSEATNCSVSRVVLNFQRLRPITFMRRIQLIQDHRSFYLIAYKGTIFL